MIQCNAKMGSDKVTVTFSLEEAVLRGQGVDGHGVSVVGDFNDWDPTVAPMVAAAGRRTATLPLLDPRRDRLARTAR